MSWPTRLYAHHDDLTKLPKFINWTHPALAATVQKVNFFAVYRTECSVSIGAGRWFNNITLAVYPKGNHPVCYKILNSPPPHTKSLCVFVK